MIRELIVLVSLGIALGLGLTHSVSWATPIALFCLAIVIYLGFVYWREQKALDRKSKGDRP